MKKHLWPIVPLCALLASGCSNTAAGLQEDAAENSQKVAKAAQEAGPAATLTPRLKTAILADKSLNGGDNRIDIDSNSETVTLNGYVATSATRLKAEQIVHAEMEKIGAKQVVVNRLEVRPPSGA